MHDSCAILCTSSFPALHPSCHSSAAKNQQHPQECSWVEQVLADADFRWLTNLCASGEEWGEGGGPPEFRFCAGMDHEDSV